MFERSQFSNEIGAAVPICPNASRILDYYDFDFSAGAATILQKVLHIQTDDFASIDKDIICLTA